MSNFWSNYIIAIVALNIFGCAWLLMWTRKMDLTNMPEDGTTVMNTTASVNTTIHYLAGG